MIVFRLVERRRRSDLGHDRARKLSARRQLRLRLLGDSLLLVAVIENRRTVLGADVRALTVQRRRIVILPEDVEQLLVRHLRRIVDELNHFGVSRASAAHILIGRVLERPAEITDGRVLHTVYVAKGRLDSPEAARPECRQLSHSFFVPIQYSMNIAGGQAGSRSYIVQSITGS